MATTFTPEELTSFKQNYDIYQAKRKPEPKALKQQTKRRNSGGVKGLLEGLMPIAGGALGAIAGTPLGPAGIIAGGAAGAAAGEAGKQKLQGGGPVDRGNLVEEAAFGAIPGVGSGIKALRAGGKASTLVSGARQAAAQAPKQGVRDKVYERGVITESRVGGFGQGEKRAGKDALGFKNTEEISKTLQKEGIKGSNANARQRGVESKLEVYKTEIDDVVAKGNKAFKPQEATKLSTSIRERILGKNGKGIASFDPTNKSHTAAANNYARQLAGIKDTKGMLAFKRSLDQDAINYGRNSAAPDPVKEALARAFRKEVNDEFGKRLPAAKAASTNYAKLAEADEFLKQAARDSSNRATSAQSSLSGRLMTSDLAQTVKSKAGIGMQKVGRGEVDIPAIPTTATTRPGPTQQLFNDLTSPRKLAAASALQAAPRAVVGGINMASPPADSDLSAIEQTPTEGDMEQAFVGGVFPGMETEPVVEEGIGAESQYPQESLIADIQRDPKNANTYLSLYKEFNQEAPTQSAAERKAAAQAKGANTALDLFERRLRDLNLKESGPAARISGLTSRLTGATGLNQDAKVYNDLRQGLAVNLAKSLGESGVLSDQDIQRAISLIPSLSDTKYEAAQKIAEIRNIAAASSPQETPAVSGIGDLSDLGL